LHFGAKNDFFIGQTVFYEKLNVDPETIFIGATPAKICPLKIKKKFCDGDSPFRLDVSVSVRAAFHCFQKPFEPNGISHLDSPPRIQRLIF